MAPNVAGIWVEGGGQVVGQGNVIRVSSDIAGATVRGLVAIDGGTISSDNDDIAAMVLTHLPDAPSECTTSNVAGIWVEGDGSTFNGHSSKIRASSDHAGATVRGAVVTDGGTISSDNDDIAATVNVMSSQAVAEHIVGTDLDITNFVAHHPYTSLGVLCGSIASYAAYHYFSKPVAGGTRTGFKTRAQVIPRRKVGGMDSVASI